MSTVVVLTPIIIAHWPAITAAVTAGVGSLGFALVRSSEVASRNTTQNRAEIEIDDSQILDQTGGDEQQLVVQREGVQATFLRDARGALRVCVEGEGYSQKELRQIGEQLIDRVTQQYVYHRVISELKQRNMMVVDEEVAQDRTVKIRVRSW